MRSLRDHFNKLVKRYWSKTRLEIKGTGLGGEDLSENKQLLEDATERFEESSKLRSKADTQKRQCISTTKKKKAQEIRKSNGEIWRDKKNVRCNTKVTLGIKTVEGVQKWLVFIRFILEKNLSKAANLDQKTCKKTMKGKLGKDSITSSLYKINKCKLSKVRQSKPCNNNRPKFWLFCFKVSKVIYFK